MESLALLLLAVDDGITMHNFENIILSLIKPNNNFNFNRHRARIKCNKNYEKIIPRFTHDQFKEMFRMDRITCENLSNVIAQHLARHANEYAPLRKKVLLTIWLLSRPVSFLAAGDRFNIPTSSAHHIFKEIVDVLVDLMPEYIQWPNHVYKTTCIDVFEERSYGFPGVIGAIDGCHIPCKQPKDNAHDYYNRKGFHSIILQGICDHRRKFIDCFIGLPGRMHDARVFRNSPVYQRIINARNPLLLAEEHIIGDSAYPLMMNVMTPFRDTGRLTVAQTRYNIKLSSIRSVIERAFGLLKGKFRRLKYLDINDIDLGKKIIAAACVLHNLILDNIDEYDINDEIEEMPNEEILNINIENEERPQMMVIQKREQIMRILSHNA
ncbi:putative nuclease HARBI1 [Odontomachus brunneus]|uniref:putative nuclease HARBI1 n=1 Tax=Odontomachus brunneus TaxID=486640 RepID=UPI0013F1E7A9|nr:putative nuclease HARBI1 [Odontomachus brunneus]